MIPPLLADVMALPPGMDALLVGLLFLIFVFDKILSIKGKLTKLPPMDQQLESLRDTLLDRLDEQDKDSVARLGNLRTHIDNEIARLHNRQDAHGEELFRLKGYVQGRESR